MPPPPKVGYPYHPQPEKLTARTGPPIRHPVVVAGSSASSSVTPTAVNAQIHRQPPLPHPSAVVVPRAPALSTTTGNPYPDNNRTAGLPAAAAAGKCLRRRRRRCRRDTIRRLLATPRRREAETQRIGDEWLASNQAAILFIPSAIVPIADSPDQNVIINHRHPAATAIHIERIETFDLDVRLL